jgi:uncharacterized protein DUF3800
MTPHAATLVRLSRRHRRGDRPTAVRLEYGPCGGGVLGDAELEFYADESGSTNANHLDPNQPFYVTGGWLIRQPDNQDLRATVLSARGSVGAKELSGPKLLNTGKGRSVCLRLVAALMRRCTPVLVIVEKRFALGMRISVELLRLPFATPSSDHPNARQDAREAASALSRSRPAVLQAANEFVKKPDAASARHCLSLLASEGLPQDIVAAAQRRLSTLSQDWRASPMLDKSLSPNVLGFTALAQKLEILATRCGREILFVHDEIPYLKQIYEFYQGLARDAKTIAPHSEFFARAGCPGLISHVSPPEFRDSSQEPLLEAADVLVGSVAALMTRVATNRGWSGREAPLAAFLLGGFIEPELRSVFHFVGSDETGMRMGEAVVAAIGLVSPP